MTPSPAARTRKLLDLVRAVAVVDGLLLVVLVAAALTAA